MSSGAEAAELGHRIRSGQRPEPFVVITVAKGAEGPWFDAEAIATRVRFKADVWVVPQQWTWDLNSLLEPDERVQGGDACIHPPSTVQPKGRLRFAARSRAEAEQSTEELISTTLAHTRGAARRATRVAPPAPPSWTGIPRDPSGVRGVATLEHVTALADRLLDPKRAVPVCVVTIPAQRADPYISAEEIAGIDPDAEVYLVATGRLTFALTGRLNPMAGVYGGAGRVYAPGQAWLDDPYTSVLRFAYDAGEGRRTTDALVNDLLSGLVRAGRATISTPRVPTPPAEGVVAGLLPPSRALVTLDDGQMATIWAELVDAELTIDAVVTKGMPVTGRVDPDTRRIDVTPMRQSWEQALAAVAAGSVVLAQVRDVAETVVRLCPFPGIQVELPTAEVTGNELDDLRDLFTAGEVVAARVQARPASGAGPAGWRLSMLDVDDDEQALCPSILVGGPPWLTEPVAISVEEGADTQVDDESEVARLVDEHEAAATRLAQLESEQEVDAATRRVAELEEALVARDLQLGTMSTQLRAASHRIGRLQAQVEHQRTVARNARAKARKGRDDPAQQPVVHGFSDPVEQFRWDLRRRWVESTRPEEKAEHPLREYLVGADFCESLDRVEGVSRDRVLNVALLLLTGRGVRGDHENRTNDAGNAPPVTRYHDGQTWVCRRAPLQVGSPSARRLSYWRGDDGALELSRVTLHDDYTP